VTALGAVVAWLLGGVPVGLVVARLLGGLDLRRHGSGNIGATNVLRTLGPGPAVLTLLGDVAKGAAATWLAARIGGEPAGALGAVAAMVGNCWSPFLGFRGGKGVATGLGAFLALAPWGLLPAAAVWVLVAAATRYVSLASVLACLTLPASVALTGSPGRAVLAAAGAAALVVLRHRDNIRRLRAGTEPRLGQRAGPA
jgi:glycerol-3-phosphate acyltransferase PlsY